MRISLTLAVAAFSALCAAALPQTGRRLSFSDTTTRWTDNRARSESDKTWIAPPDRFRFEQTSGDKAQVTILNGSDVWQYFPALKRGFHRKLSAGDAAKLRGKLVAGVEILAEFKKLGARRIGEKRIDSKTCTVYRHTASNGLATTLYVLPGPEQLIRRQEQNGVLNGAESMGAPMRTYVVKSVTDYSNWQVNGPMPDSLFKPPAGIAIQEGKTVPPPVMIPAPAPPKRR